MIHMLEVRNLADPAFVAEIGHARIKLSRGERNSLSCPLAFAACSSVTTHSIRIVDSPLFEVCPVVLTEAFIIVSLVLRQFFTIALPVGAVVRRFLRGPCFCIFFRIFIQAFSVGLAMQQVSCGDLFFIVFAVHFAFSCTLFAIFYRTRAVNCRFAWFAFPVESVCIASVQMKFMNTFKR